MRLFSSESVSEGHPDKIADQVSDAVLDAMLADDPDSRVACETLVTTGMALVAGEITTNTYVDIPQIVRDTLARIGYDRSAYGIDAHTCAVLSTLDKQSPDIAQGVDTGGAGDQGMMFGYACDETPELMPAPVVFAHRITKRMAELRHSGEVGWMRPDSKSQVTLAYDGDRAVKVHTVVVSTQHDPDVDNETIAQVVREQVVLPVLPEELLDPNDCIFHINPTGRFEVGGPHGDAGLTGRKIIVDTYGGVGRHGGGAFSGKDSTKVDRSAAYAARWAAKNVVAAGLAKRCEIQLAYAIGVIDPVSVHIDTFGTGTLPDEQIEKAVRKVFDFRPKAIIERLSLRTPIFLPTATYGHFGRECVEGEATIMGPRPSGESAPQVRFFPWEATDRVDELKSAIA